jgi:hypothetical protein
MNQSNHKKISRRDAIKLLGAVTGATVLANLPSKWKTPQLARGVLPAHAQTSQCFVLSIVVTTAATATIFGGANVAPDINTAGTTYALGTGMFWNCGGTGCIRYEIDTGGTVVLELTPLGYAPITFTFPSVPRSILVDRATGNYALDYQNPTPGNCSWN